MSGGNYYTWFKEDDIASRKILYFLESKGIANLSREKMEKKEYFQYQWELTKKGESLVEKDKNLQKFWKEGRIIELYNSIKELLGEQ